MLPVNPAANQADGCWGNPVRPCHRRVVSGVRADSKHLGLRKFGKIDSRSLADRAVEHLVRDISGAGVPAEIGNGVVVPGTVKVAAFHALGSWTDKGFKNEPVNLSEPNSVAATVCEADVEVSCARIWLRLEDSLGHCSGLISKANTTRNRTNVPSVRHFVGVLEPKNWTPERVGHGR